MTVTHDPAAHRFLARVPEGLAYLAYEPAGDGVLDFQHTLVPDGAKGQGIGSALVTAAFDYARAGGFRVIATCPYVNEWLDGHPESLDLVVSAGE
jgi:predicted GNAT family acetyltransferase